MPLPFMHGYQWKGHHPPDDVTDFLASGWSWASGGIVSTPLDQTRFIRGYIGRQLFDATTQQAQFAFVDGGPNRRDRGRTGPGSPSSDTGRGAGSCSDTRGTHPDSRSSWRRPDRGVDRRWCR